MWLHLEQETLIGILKTYHVGYVERYPLENIYNKKK